MTIIRREIVIAIEEDATNEYFGVEVLIPEGMSTLEAVGLMETAKAQYMQSKSTPGPSIYESPDEA